MAQTTLQPGASHASSLGSRFVGIITSPRATYENVVAHPTWFGMLAIASVLGAVLMGGFLSTQVGQDAWLAQIADAAAGKDNAAQQIEAMEKFAPWVGAVTAVSVLIFTPLMYVIAAGILFAVFNATMGGDASFKKVFAVAVHSAPIGVLAQLFTVPMNFARGTMTSATNLGVLLPMLEEESFAAKLLGTIELFLIWQLFVLAMGLAVLYRRRTQPIAIALFGVYAVIAIIIAVVKSGG